MRANAVTWSIAAALLAVMMQLIRIGHVDVTITTLTFLGGGITGALWAVVMWELKFKEWRQRMDEYAKK